MARRKYNNQPTVMFGLKFDSGAEAARYLQLLSREQAGEITELEHHVIYPLAVNGAHICNYEPDFRYRENGAIVVEDVKGGKATITAVYRLKKKLMLAIYGIKIQEVRMR